ncbi:hypothetical protein PVBG_05904 [Plasmodium vivax Brazil I]|uniref:Variable surface protein n=1 Tax=Plasmodium vivax (strain Brazil I) TaxID=1033975 RepID=A0A0J9SMR0_PLAV1|nr:hypothetical protein PVBG_05904 [Plasmodium vivax Brazil I]
MAALYLYKDKNINIICDKFKKKVTYKYNFGIFSNKIYNIEKKSVIRFQRSLATHATKKELDRSKIRDIISGNNSHNNVKCTSDDLSKYSQLKKKGLNDLDLYKKLYNHRYSKKSVLGKFDCFCEKKVFHKIEDIEKIIDKMQNDKKLLKKNYVFGLIVPMLYNEYFNLIFDCFSDCSHSSHNKSGGTHHDDEKYIKAKINESTWDIIEIVNFTFLCVSTFIVLSIIIYIFIKFIKYQRLKACRSKMSIKEYCKFCKSLFI